MGHWSSWQNYGLRSFPYQRFAPDTLDNGQQVFQYAEAASGATSWPNMATQLASQLALARAGTGTFGLPTPGGTNAQFSADKSNRIVGAGSGHSWHSSVQLGQSYISFVDPGHENDLDPLPPLLASLTQGVDWDYNPDTGEAVQYDGFATRVGWEDWHTTIEVGVGATLPPQEGQVTVNDVTTFVDYNQSYYWQALSFDPRGLWVPFGMGTSVGSHIGHSSVLEPTYQDELILSLSGLGNVPAIHLAIQPGSLGVDGVPFADFTVVSGPTTDYKGRFYLQLVATWGIDAHRYDQAGPAVVYQQPRFRYWVPSNIIPPLRFNQRDDGFGSTAGHARLNLAGTVPNQPASINDARIQRVGGRNTYL